MTVRRFQSKPVVIEAMQWDRTEERYDAIDSWTEHVIERNESGGVHTSACYFMLILKGWDDLARDVLGADEVESRREAGFDAVVYDTLHGTWVNVRENDWIIRGTQGEFYPCIAEVFARKYEAVDDAPNRGDVALQSALAQRDDALAEVERLHGERAKWVAEDGAAKR